MTTIQNPGDFPTPQGEHQGQLQTEVKPPRRGIALLEKAEDLEISHEGREIITKPIPVSSIGMLRLHGDRYNFEDYKITPAYTLDENGDIIEGSCMDFYNKGYFNFALFADGPTGSHKLPSLKVNLWIGDGPVISDQFDQESKYVQGPPEPEDFAMYLANFDRGDSYLFLPPNPDLLKKIRVSFENLPTGGGAQI